MDSFHLEINDQRINRENHFWIPLEWLFLQSIEIGLYQFDKR